MIVNDYWTENWRKGSSRVLVSYDDDYEYWLRCDLEDGKYTVDLARRESTSGEEIGMTRGIVEYVSAMGAREAVIIWGEKIANDWLAEHQL